MEREGGKTRASSTNAPTEAPSDVDVAAGGGHPPSSLLGATVSWVGPCGSLQVPLASVPNHLLVCGGVGITPMLAILEALASEKTKDDKTTGTRAMATRTTTSSSPAMETGKGRAVLVWSVRGLELPTALWPTLSALATAADVQVRVFDTTPMAPPAGTAASSPTTRMMHRNSAKGKVTETPALVSRSDRRTAHVVSRTGHSSETPATMPLHTHEGEVDGGKTQSCRGDDEDSQTVEQKMRSVMMMGRPDIAQILREEFSAPSAAQAPAAPTSPVSTTGGDDAATGACPWTTAKPAVASPPSVPVVGLYCCGPQGMAKQCIAAATARGSTFVHNEQF